ncbi:MAG TPA: EF-hand domain-containing protein [Rhodopila sp.]|jgi:Ca2+-binding EF-hand superfamily protein
MARNVIYTGLLGVVMAGGLATASAASADTTPGDKSAVMSKIDTDNDGTISLDEAKKAAVAKFDALDTDKEGTLDASELTGILSHSDMVKADKDKEGTVDKAEFLALVEKRFAAADTDKDGTLSPQELSTEQERALVALLAY